MTTQGKSWGQTKLITSNKALELHLITIKKGGFCSKHKHHTKFNGFLVFSGLLMVRIWKPDQGLVDSTEIGPGEYTEITPGHYHQFEALEDTTAIEIYWAEFDPADIERQAKVSFDYQDPCGLPED